MAGGRPAALPLQYIKLSAAMRLLRQAEEQQGYRYALVLRQGVSKVGLDQLCLNLGLRLNCSQIRWETI